MATSRKISQDEVFATIAKMLSKLLNLPTERFQMETEIFDELPLDSLQLYELVVDLENQYSIRISDEAIEKVRTIRDVVDMITDPEQ